MKITTKTIIAICCLAVLAGWCTAADTKAIKNRDGSCQVDVPANWTSALAGIAESPDGQFTMALSSPKMIDSFAELKQGARNNYKDSKVTKDAATEFEMEGKSLGGTPDVYRAIQVGAGKFCIIEVTYKNGAAEASRKIAETLKGGK